MSGNTQTKEIPQKMNQKQFNFMNEMPLNYEIIALEIGKLLNEKQNSYGNAFGEMAAIFKILYPEQILPHQYGDILTIARIMDKIFRISNLPESKIDSMGEEPWKDIAGYAILALQNTKET